MQKFCLHSSRLMGTLLSSGSSEPAPFFTNFKAGRSNVSSSAETSEDDDFSFETIFSSSPESRYQALMNSWEGYILVCGWEDANNCGYDVSGLTKEEKDFAIERGLEILEANAELKEYMSFIPAVLSNYFLSKKNYKKSLYWSFRGVENGCPNCMLLLSNAYRNGEGVVQDFEEGIKWIYLGAAVGDDWCQNWVKENSIMFLTTEYFAPIMEAAQKKASQWMSKHPALFISRE